MTPAQRTTRARLAAHTSWAATVGADARQKRTAPGHSKSPTSIEYWRHRFAEEHPQLAEREREAAAQNAHTAYMTKLSMRAAEARRKKDRPA